MAGGSGDRAGKSLRIARDELSRANRRAAAPAPPDLDLLDLMQESLIAFGLDGRITRWNAASERIYGWSRKHAVGRPFEEIFGGREWPSAQQLLDLGEVGPCARELRRTAANGAEVIVCAQLSLRHGPVGEPLELVETGVDVTAQRRAEMATEAGRSHYRNVFQAIPASVWDIDFSEGRALALSWLGSATVEPRQWLRDHPERVRELMRATYARDVNEQAMALFGPCDRDSLLVDVERYWPQSSTEVFGDWVASSLANEPFFSRETRQRRFDGREFDALFTASYAPGMVERGQLVVSIVDYTDVKQNQAAVRESEAFYTDMFHTSAFAAFHLDATRAWAIYRELSAQGVRDLRAYVDQNPELLIQIIEGVRVVDVNATTLRLFEAKDRSEIVGGSIRPLWFVDRMEPLLSSLDDAYRNISTYQGPATMRTLLGNEIEVFFTRSASEALSAKGQVLLAIVDMTDKVKAQNELAEMQANFAHAARISSLGELTASIAHEVNQPLAAIAANGEAALRWLGRTPPEVERLRGLTADMISDARRASDIVAHVRSMASPQVGRHERVALNGVVEEALALLDSQLAKCGTLAVPELQPDLPEIMGDPIQLQQVVVNLLLNAMQAMARKPGSRVRVRVWADSGEVYLTVSDNGPGIQADDLQRLFSSFFTTKPDGMGIGLAICRTILEAHGGSISAGNLEGGGACFQVRLPTIDQSRAPSYSPEPRR
jgi:PAS domain S-box-containing protein